MTRFLNKRNILAMFLIVILCGCGISAAPFIAGNANSEMTIWQIIFTYSRNEVMQFGDFGSAYAMTMCFIESDWFAILLPALISFYWIYDFTEQWEGSNYYFAVSRSTRKKYAYRTMGKAAFMGAVPFVLGVLLFTALMYIIFPVHTDPALSYGIVESYGATAFLRFVKFMQIVFHITCECALLSMITTLLAALLNNRFLAVSIPVLIEYISWKLFNTMGIYNYSHEIPDRIRNTVYFLLPSVHFKFGQSFEDIYGISYLFYFLFMVAVGGVITFFFYKLVEGRSR